MNKNNWVNVLLVLLSILIAMFAWHDFIVHHYVLFTWDLIVIVVSLIVAFRSWI